VDFIAPVLSPAGDRFADLPRIDFSLIWTKYQKNTRGSTKRCRPQDRLNVHRAAMRKDRSPDRLARIIDYALARRPDEFGLVPDSEGFVKLKDLLKALHEEPGLGYVNRSHLNEILLGRAEPPFEMRESLIRARRRVPPPADDAPPPLPKILFTCIRRRAYPWVQQHGIYPSAHAGVVLAGERSLAERLGRRIDPQAVVLTVQVAACTEKGVVFERRGEGLYLSGAIPANCFTGPPLARTAAEEDRKTTEPVDAAQRHPTPGSFAIDPARAAAPHVPKSLRPGDEKGRTAERKRQRGAKSWSREKPPWRK
jgi:putative RNA 2'-phosphotransferase